MRPALLRLLKRPSALSVLDSLASAPIGIEQLESRYKYECLRSHSQGARQKDSTQDLELEKSGPHHPCTRSTLRTPSFCVYDIRPQKEGETVANCSAKGDVARLDLQPEQLDFESDIGHTDDLGTRLVDKFTHRHNFALWEDLLRYRQRHYGDKGTLDIWEGLTVRVEGIWLPVRGERADFFWQSFVDIGLKREAVVHELVNYASELCQKSGSRWDKFHQSVVGGFIERGMTRQAVQWHKRLQNTHLSNPNHILRVLKQAINLHHQSHSGFDATYRTGRRAISPGLRAFQNIYSSTNGPRIYRDAINTLLENDSDDAFAMHMFLVKRGDRPQTYEDIQPLLEYLQEHGPRRHARELHSYASEYFADQVEAGDENASIEKESPPTASESGRDKPFNDEFGARLFATKALNFEVILSGLHMFGVSAIGPQSLREMAVRAHGGQDILDKLRALDKAKISTGDHVYARLLRKLVTEKRDFLLSDLLRSDQHPDVLEDALMQESLLISNYLTRDWPQYNLALAVLSEISTDEHHLPNVQFRKHIAAGEWDFASKAVDDMAIQGKMLTSKSINFMVDQVLTPRRKGVGPPVGPHLCPSKEVAFIIRILQRAVPMGTSVSTTLWVEMLKRLGMANQWDDFRECTLWLARQYSPISKPIDPSWEIVSSIHKSRPKTSDKRQLQVIFDSHMQAAILTWGFKMRVSSKPKDYKPFGEEGGNFIPWIRGLVLLRELEQNGVHLLVEEVRRSCRHRLAVLFGRPRQSSRHMNRMLSRENPYSAERVMEDINRAWGEPLFGGREHGDFYRLVNPPSSKMSQRRTQRTVLRESRLQGREFLASR